MAKNIRFQGLVKTTAQLESDKFAGRIGWNSTLARFVAYYSSTLYAQMARRDVLETFAEGLLDSTLTAGRMVSTTTGGRLQSLDAAGSRALIGAQAALGYTPVNKAGDAMTGSLSTTERFAARTEIACVRALGTTRATASRWSLLSNDETYGASGWIDSGNNLRLAFLIGDGNWTDRYIFGNNGNLNVVAGAIQTAGVTRISAAGAVTATSLSSTDLAGSGTRLAAIGASGNLIEASGASKSVMFETLFTGRSTVAVTNAVLSTLIPTKTFPANFWSAGKCVRGKIQMYSGHSSIISISLGGNEFANFAIPAVFRGELEFALTCETTGSTAKFAFCGTALGGSTSGTPVVGSSYFGDSTPTGAWSNNWSINTANSSDLTIQIYPSYTEDVYLVHGSLTTFTP